MKLSSGLSLGLALCLSAAPFAAPEKATSPAPASAAASAAPIDTVLTQSQAGRALILGVLSRKVEAVTPYLIDSLRPDLTPEVMEGLRSQMGWLYDMIGGDFDESMRGTRTFEDGAKVFYREYVMSSTADRRAPLLVIQVLFPDSVQPRAVGLQVKSFLGGEKFISGAKVWKIDGREIEIHQMLLAENAEGKFLAIQIHDPDTAALDRDRIGRIATPLIREAIARGYLDSAKAANAGVDVQKTVGVVFLRRDPNAGFVHARVAFSPQEYAVGALEKLWAAADSAAAKPAPAKTPAKTPAKKKKK